ncbi:hypothetical protein [Mycobacteroides franklinii]|uniref:hypothetical protein n=1 Tax=Mycobacteroides franklinii TaxID=948102 RepID=UPI0013E8E8C2
MLRTERRRPPVASAITVLPKRRAFSQTPHTASPCSQIDSDPITPGFFKTQALVFTRIVGEAFEPLSGGLDRTFDRFLAFPGLRIFKL